MEEKSVLSVEPESSPRWTIYCHTHIESGRHYIGLTKQTWQDRWAGHVSQALSRKSGWGHFQNAIRKYGKDAFSHQELERCESLEEANFAEVKWIEFYNTRNPDFGFNIAKGGGAKPHPVKADYWNTPGFREMMASRDREGASVESELGPAEQTRRCRWPA